MFSSAVGKHRNLGRFRAILGLRHFVTSCLSSQSDPRGQTQGNRPPTQLYGVSPICRFIGDHRLASFSRDIHTRSTSLTSRHFSSRRDRGDDSWKNMLALPYSVSPEDAIQKFNQWAIQEQGLNYLLNWESIRIGASYVPVWTFDLNVRFVRKNYPKGDPRRYNWKPDMFSVYGDSKSVIHLPGMSSYAGHSFQRSLIHPVHGTTLVFMNDQLVPFDNWMLRDMNVNGVPLQVVPDAWNATRGRAFAVLRHDLKAIARDSLENGEEEDLELQTQVVSSRRCMMPTYYIDYKILGMEYRAFVSGCDAGAAVSGVSHKVLNVSNNELRQASNSIFSGAYAGARIVAQNRQLMTSAIIFLQFAVSWIARIFMRIPIIGVIGGVFVGFRKIVQPWMANQVASAEWEQQREHEATMDEDDYDRSADFYDDGSAERFYWRNRERILRHLHGDSKHDHGDFDWYSEWEQWARQQWEQQQRQQATYEGQQQRRDQKQRAQKQQKSKPDFQWDFDPNDPYSVLGIRRGASSKEVSAAFRKQMLMHHPDRRSHASEAEKERATERSKLISEAYREIRTELKRHS